MKDEITKAMIDEAFSGLNRFLIAKGMTVVKIEDAAIVRPTLPESLDMQQLEAAIRAGVLGPALSMEEAAANLAITEEPPPAPNFP